MMGWQFRWSKEQEVGCCCLVAMLGIGFGIIPIILMSLASYLPTGGWAAVRGFGHPFVVASYW